MSGINSPSSDVHPAVLAWKLLQASALLESLSDAFHQWVAHKDWSEDERIKELLDQVEKFLKEGKATWP